MYKLLIHKEKANNYNEINGLQLLCITGGGCGHMYTSTGGGCGHLICACIGLASLSLGVYEGHAAVLSWFQELATRERSHSDSSISMHVMCDCASCEGWGV